MCAIFSFLVGNTKKYRKELVFSYNFIKFALNNSGQTQNSIHLKINMEFNYNQKISMMRVLLDIIYADCKVDYRETELFKVLQQEFELSNDDLKKILNKYDNYKIEELHNNRVSVDLNIRYLISYGVSNVGEIVIKMIDDLLLSHNDFIKKIEDFEKRMDKEQVIMMLENI